MNMIQRLISLSFLFTTLSILPAQTPVNITVDGDPGGVIVRAPTQCNEAGTIRRGPHSGQSNDVFGEVIYLCAGDSLQLFHNGDFDLSGDPNPGTLPGIGYAFYDCPPSEAFAGPDLATVQTDTCLNRTDPIIVGGAPQAQTDGIWIAGQEPGGNIMLSNQGQLQNAFNGGAPVQFWFAPITVDNFADFGFEQAGGIAGPCVDVNPAAAFSVIYLNPIEITDLSVTPGSNGCGATFTVLGGLPELDGDVNYTITMVKEDDPAVLGEIVRNPLPDHGEEVAVFAPQPGNYLISIEDGKSCAGSVVVDLTGCEAVSFKLPLANARPGERICLPLTVENFNNVSVFQGTITWDESVLRFDGVENFNSDLTNSQESFETPAPNLLTYSWLDALTGYDLPDEAVLFEVCFEVIGVFGQSSPVGFTDDPTPVEVGNSDTEPLGFVLSDGQVNISNDMLFLGLEPRDVSCAGERDGAIAIRVAQGTPDYRIFWREVTEATSNGPLLIEEDGGSATIPNLPGAQYEIRVEDASNPAIVMIDTVIIDEPPALGASIDDTQPSCFGDSDGEVSVQVSVGGIVQGDLSDFSFQWNTTNEDTPLLDSVASGPYSVTVTDQRGCTATAGTTLSQPAPIITDPTITDASCSGAANGGIVVTAAGGNSGNGIYTFDWDSLGTVSGSNATLTGLTPGEYPLIVTDEVGCSTSELIVVGAGKTLSISEVITPVSCYNGDDGAVFLAGTTAGAAAELPYTFTWEGPGLPADDSDQGENSRRENLAAGAYTVTMADADPAGCQVVERFTVTQPDSIEIMLVSKNDESCTVGNDGGAIIEVAGGAAPYRFQWLSEERDTVAADSIATGLSAGAYSAQVIDLNSCLDSLDVFINAPTPPQIQPIENDQLECPGDSDGALSVTATPGNAPITGYQWSNNATTTTITDLPPGIYYVTVSAEDGCTSVDSAQVIAPAPLAIDSIIARAPSCAGDSDGSLLVFASGGTQPFTYSWADGPTSGSDLLPGLSAGDYFVSVSDANNCETVSDMGTVSDPPAIVITIIDTLAVSCFDDICDGQATIAAAYEDGSSGLFNFTWASGESTTDADQASAVQLCAGPQPITVTDVNQCALIDSIDMPSPAPITITGSITPVTCNGLTDGSVDLSISGGTPDYDILWAESGATTPGLSDLPAGIYNALITDENGCSKSQRIEIEEPAPLVLSLDSILTTNPSCNASTDGAVGVRYNSDENVNPLGPDPYTWAGGVAPSSDAVADNLSAGTYAVTLTDAKGCQDSLVHTLNEPPPVIAVIPDPADPRCFGESTILFIDTVFGGNGSDPFDYMYQIDNSGISFTVDQPAEVLAGERIVTVEDPAGCTYIDTLQINQPDELSVEFDPEVVVVELGDSTTRLDPIISSSLPIDSFIWNPTDYLQPPNVQRPILNNPLISQEYTLTVVDVNGCTGGNSVFVEVDKNRNIYIPNVFSPNGDGPNDEFRIYACKGVARINYVRVFDRWGALLTEGTDLFPVCDGGTVIWDGLIGGQEMPAGVYVYVIEVEFIDNTSLVYRGDVSLLR